MIKVMVADDNESLNSSYCKFLTKDKNIEIVGNTYDGEQTLKKYFEVRPDVLILDLDLPKMTGLEIIDKLCKDPEEKKKCNVIVVSGQSDFRNKLYNTRKVFMNLQKPVNEETILKLIKDYEKEYMIPNPIDENDVEKLLVEFNVTPYTKNSSVLISATLRAYTNHNLLSNSKLLYSVVGKEKNMSSKQVQWSIRNSINNINRNITDEQYKKVFYSNPYEKIITPTMFFIKVIQYFENR